MEKEKAKIQFRPLHEGMGFHPFSDGLPYAPESKSKYPTGAGATTAGRPQFVTQTAPTVSQNTQSKPMGTARQLQQQQTRAAHTQSYNQATQAIHPALEKRIPSRTVVNPTTNPTAKIAPTIAPSMSPDLSASVMRRRIFAYLMDTMIHAGFWLATNLTALFLFKFQIDSEIVKDNFGQFFIFFCVSQWMFIALQEMLFENSIGKAFFNLEFKRNHSSLLLRSIVFAVSVAFFGLGLFFRPQDKLGQIQLKSKIYSS